MGYYDPPEDLAAEAMAEVIDNAFKPITKLFTDHPDLERILDRRLDEVQLNLMKLLDRAYAYGYVDGQSDEARRHGEGE